MARSAELAGFLAAAEEALLRCTGPAAELARTVVGRWGTVGGAQMQGAELLPVCRHISQTLAANTSALSQAFAAIAPQLCWRRRGSADPADTRFWDGHANAMILGPGGLEERSDVWVGVSLMAPGTLYPDHNHPPDEVYLPLSPGEWWNAAMDWTDPGLNGFIYNPPGILHAMRAGEKPFLALWFLPI